MCCAHRTQGSYVGAICFLNSNSLLVLDCLVLLARRCASGNASCGCRRELTGSVFPMPLPLEVLCLKSHRGGIVVISQDDAMLKLSSSNRPHPEPSLP